MQHTRTQTHLHACVYVSNDMIKFFTKTTRMKPYLSVPESKKAQNKVYLSTYIDLGPQTDSSPASKLMSVSRVSRGRREGKERGKKTKMIKRGNEGERKKTH